MALIKKTRRNVTIIAWALYPVFVASIFVRVLPVLFREAADDVWHEIDRWRPFDDYSGEGRGPSVRKQK